MISPFSSARNGHGPSLRLGSRAVFPFVHRPISLAAHELNAHLHVMGTTGVGKSKFLAHLATQLMVQGRACAVVDPHADLATDILAILLDRGYFRRPDAMQRLLYVDFSDPTAFVPFNVLSLRFPPHTVAAIVLEAMHRAWSELAGGVAPTFDTLILNGVKLLISNRLPLTHLYPLLSDRAYRDRLLERESDAQVVAVWRGWFDRLSPRDQADQAGAALRRANLLTFHPALRYSLGQTENRLDFRRLTDRQISVVCTLGGLDEETQRLLGCLLSVGFETAALSREDTPEDQRLPYHLIMDEFSMFSARSEESLARVVSLARKYRLFLVLAHQTWSQVSARLQGALQNATPIYFRLGFDDATWAGARLSEADPYTVKHTVRPLARELPVEYHPAYLSLPEQDRLMAARLEHLPPRHAYIKLDRPVPWPLRPFVAKKRSRVVEFTTTTVGRTRPRPEEIDALTARYATQLLTPLSRVQDARPVLPLVFPMRRERVCAAMRSLGPARASSSPMSDSPSPSYSPALSSHVLRTLQRKTPRPRN